MKKLMVVLAAMGFSVGVYAADAVKPDADAAKAEAIKAADADKDGKITVVEYMAIYKLDEAAAKKADLNSDGVISVEEFVIVVPAKEEKKEKKEKKAKKAE